MKKIIALLLVAVMALGMAACAGTGNNEVKDTTAVTEDQITVGSAVEVLETVWALYGEEEKFFAMGGDFNAPVDNAPGNVDVTNTEFLQYNLLVPEAQWASVTEAASLIHGMNANTFTCGVYKVSDANAFATAMQTAVQGNQWMCGFPETLIVYEIGGYVLVAFGVNDAINPFLNHLATAYAGATELVNEPIA